MLNIIYNLCLSSSQLVAGHIYIKTNLDRLADTLKKCRPMAVSNVWISTNLTSVQNFINVCKIMNYLHLKGI